MASQPVNGGAGVFLSYVREDNRNDACRITKWFHAELERKVALFRGARDIEFFLDTEDIKWGQNWRKRIEESVHEVKVFMPIITAGYFRRDWCLQELKWFLEHEQQIGRDDLILPIYFIESEDFEHRQDDPLLVALADHQLVDLREMRDKMRNKAGKREQLIEQLARRLLETLKRLEEGDETPVVVEVEPPPSAAGTNGKAVATGKVAADESKPEVEQVEPEREPAGAPATVVVGADGDYDTLAEAIADAADGSELVLRPGLHEGGVTIEKTLHLRGEGKQEAVVQAAEKTAITFAGPTGGLTNLVIRQTAAGEAAAVEIRAGRTVVEDCELESAGGSCLVVSGAADPQVRRCLVRGGGNGIEIVDDAQGRYEDNEVTDAPMPGIAAASNGSPTVSSNRVHGCSDAGILLAGGSPRVEANEIFENAGSGIVAESCAPVVRRNRIRDGQDAGIVVTEGAQGFFEENEISGHEAVGIGVDNAAEPIVRRNRIWDGRDTGIYVHDDGRGTFEENELQGNARGGAWITTGAAPTFVRNLVHDNPEGGIFVRDSGQAALEDNEIWANDGPGIAVSSGAVATIRENRIHHGLHGGVLVDEGGSATLEENEIAANEGAGVVVAGRADPVLRRNQIHDGVNVGVFVIEGGRGTIEENEIYANATGGVWIESGGEPTLTENELRDNGGPGLVVTNGGKGRAEGNIVQGNAGAGVSITLAGDPVLVRNRVFGSHGQGVYVGEGGAGTIEENDVFANEGDGVSIAGGDPVVRGNAIHDGGDTGIYVTQAGAGEIEGNDIYGNARAGVWIQGPAIPTISQNRIHDHQENGVVVVDGGGGWIRENQVFRNLGNGVVIGLGCAPEVEENLITLNVGAGLALGTDGQVIAISGNKLSGNYRGPIEAADISVVQYYLQLNGA
jgi:F-box protein 11